MLDAGKKKKIGDEVSVLWGQGIRVVPRPLYTDSDPAGQVLNEQPSLAFTCAGICAHIRPGPSWVEARKGDNN